jgi:hypothetical protein
MVEQHKTVLPNKGTVTQVQDWFKGVKMAKGDYSCENKIFKLTELAIYDRKGIANNRAVEESKKYLSPLAKRASAIITTDRVMSTLYAFQPISERSWFRKLRK